MLVAVASEQQRDLVVEAARAGLDAQGRQDGGQGACRAVLGGDREVVDDDQLVAARDDGGQLRQGQPVGAVQYDHVEGAAGGRQHRHHRGDRHEDGQQVAYERVGDK